MSKEWSGKTIVDYKKFKNLKTSKFSRKLAVGGGIRRFGKNWKEQLAAYFGKVDLDIDIKAIRSR